MAVAPSLQRRGIGGKILDHLLDWLRRHGDPIPFLDASDAGAPLYKAAGFSDDGHTAVWSSSGRGAPLSPQRPASLIAPGDLPDVSRFDAELFGADRSPILASYLHDVPNSAFLTRAASGQITGYLFVRGERLGPWLATNPDDAERLLVTALSLGQGDGASVRPPSQNPFVDAMLERHGFRLERSLRHMYLADEPPKLGRQSVYGLASFAIG